MKYRPKLCVKLTLLVKKSCCQLAYEEQCSTNNRLLSFSWGYLLKQSYLLIMRVLSEENARFFNP